MAAVDTGAVEQRQAEGVSLTFEGARVARVEQERRQCRGVGGQRQDVADHGGDDHAGHRRLQHVAHRVPFDQVADLVSEHRRDLVVVPGGGDQLVEEHHGAARQRERIGADRRTPAELEHVAAASEPGEGVEAGRERGPAGLGELRGLEGQAIERRQRLRAHLSLDTRVHACGDDPRQRRHAEDDAAPQAGDDQRRGDERWSPADLELVDPALHAGRRVPGDLGQLECRLDQATGAVGQIEPARQIAEPRLESDPIDRHRQLDSASPRTCTIPAST